MTEKTDLFLAKLREAFETEAIEQVQTVIELLISLESAQLVSQRETIIEVAFREIHNLKGSARTVELLNIESICHPMESILSLLKKGVLKPGAEVIDLCLAGARSVKDAIELGQETLTPEQCELVDKLRSILPSSLSEDEGSVSVNTITIIEATQEQPKDKNTQEPNDSKPGSYSQERRKATIPTPSKERSESIRVSVAKLDLFMQRADEMLSIKSMAAQQARETKSLSNMAAGWQRTLSTNSSDLTAIKSLISKLANTCSNGEDLILLTKLADYLDGSQKLFNQLEKHSRALASDSVAFSRAVEMNVDELLDDSKKLLMMPTAVLFEPFPLLVRELSKQLGKEVDFLVDGQQIELDKRILHELKDPLTHILRNAIDHGIEEPSQRLAQGKSRRGQLSVHVRQPGPNLVEIEIKDNGKGISIDRLIASAVKAGHLSLEEASRLDRTSAHKLIFKSAVSTSEILTEISGRGVGMAVVEENIHRLGGTIQIQSEEGLGTAFLITLPTTMATFRGVLVDVSSQTLVLPTRIIDRVIRIGKKAVRTVEGIKTVTVEGMVIPLCHMKDVLRINSSRVESMTSDFYTVSILGVGERRVGFVVDEVKEEQEVLVKSLTSIMPSVQNVSGVTVLGTGKVAPILNADDLITNSRQYYSTNRILEAPVQSIPDTPAFKKQKKVLVVDDTLTARILMRNILELAGHHISTANDGREALDLLLKEKYDLLITDLEMPRMNGFELTKAVRSESTIKDIPIIIVTSMTSREDRENGVKVGANAYFVKSSFDQNNLIDVVNNLI